MEFIWGFLLVMLFIWFVGSVVLLFRLITKLRVYEQAISEFYEDVSLVIHTMRALDEQNMFEQDDEVGTVFTQLRDVVYSLGTILYGSSDDNEAEEA